MADSSLKHLPGFRFHPTNEEIIVDYLLPKTVNQSYTTPVMGEVDLNMVEPWKLASKAKMGEKEWYFFCHQGKKYPTGTRVDRSTKAGFWKATGKDMDIINGEKVLIGKRKTLVFYTGRAPRGEKTKWVMKEFRIEGSPYPNLPSQNEWVISKVSFKGPMDERKRMKSIVQQVVPDSDTMPALMDVSEFMSVESQVSHKGPMTMNGSDSMKSIVQQLVPDSANMPSLMDVSNFSSVESQVSHKGPTTMDGSEKMKSIAQQLVPDTVTIPSLKHVSIISSRNSGYPESSRVNVGDIMANSNYFSSSNAYGAAINPQMYDPYIDDEDLELIKALSTFDDEAERAIGSHTDGEQMWNHKMMVGALHDAAGTSTDWNMEDWWLVKEKEMGYDVQDLDDPMKI